MKKHIKKVFSIKVFRYAIGWWLAAVIDLACLIFFTEVFWIHYLVSALLAFVISFCFGFLFQKYITFQCKQKKHVSQGGMFLFFQLIWVGFNLLSLWFFVECFGFYYIYIAFLNKIIIFVWNYYMNNRFNFK